MELKLKLTLKTIHNRKPLKMTEIFDYPIFRITIAGSQHVGKSSLTKLFVSNTELNNSYYPTIGVDFSAHIIQLDGVKIKLHFLDTAGIERYPPITHTYYRRALGVIIVYDVTDHYSFDKLEYYVSKALRFAEEETKIMLVANKCDLIEDRKVSFETGKEFADANNLLYFEVSCKSREQVEYAIVSLLSLIVENMKRRDQILKQTIASSGSTDVAPHSSLTFRGNSRSSLKCNVL